MFLLSLLTNKYSYNTQIIKCLNDTIFRKRFRVPAFWNRFWDYRTGSLEPVLTSNHYSLSCRLSFNYCLSAVTFVHPTQSVKFLAIFLHCLVPCYN